MTAGSRRNACHLPGLRKEAGLFRADQRRGFFMPCRNWSKTDSMFFW